MYINVFSPPKVPASWRATTSSASGIGTRDGGRGPARDPRGGPAGDELPGVPRGLEGLPARDVPLPRGRAGVVPAAGAAPGPQPVRGVAAVRVRRLVGLPEGPRG